MNEKRAIDLLIKIAERQQQMIQKLAIVVGRDPNIEYLMGAIPVAAASAGISNVVVIKVDIKPAAQSESGARLEGGYITYIKGIPPKMGNIFKQVWDKQLASQKPDLVGKVSFIFQG